MIDIQKIFLKKLTSYINGGCINQRSKLISILIPSFPFKKNAKKIIQLFNEFNLSLSKKNFVKLEIEIKEYDGDNLQALKLIDYISKFLLNDIKGAYVFGSLGTHEAVDYSDFDALMIIKNDVFHCPKRLARVAQRINYARSFMYEFDPLQHHGWFVLTEAHLYCFPEYYLPSEIFRFSRSLLQDREELLRLHVQESAQKNKEAFENLSTRITRLLNRRKYPKNLYQLKGFLSQVLLLPSSYIRARYNRGIYKKFSFEQARKDFSHEDWEVIDTASSIRIKWKYKISRLQRWIMVKPNFLARYYAANFAPKIPEEIANDFTPHFYEKLKKLLLSMNKNVRQRQSTIYNKHEAIT